MKRPPQGRYVRITTAGEPFQAFVPAPLPPKPPLRWSSPLRRKFDDALLALGRVDGIAEHLPNASLVLSSFIRKEAVLSSQIEGTLTTLADLLTYEVDEEPAAPVDDAHEVSRCVAAIERGRKKLHDGLPVSMRLLNEMHKALMSHRHGRAKTPGEVRRSQVWIGGTRPNNAAFVPPPATELPKCLQSLERFINDEPEPTPPLIKAALTHVQFETIHPYLDGNGRIGRLLILLQLIADGVIREPMLYPSLFFKRHRPLYYELLNEVRLNGDWERWLDFFAEGIQVSASEAVATANALLALVNADRGRIAGFGRAAGSALEIHIAMQKLPIATANALVRATKLTPPTVNKSLAHLERAGIVRELTNRRRHRIFSYTQYVELLASETEAKR